MRNVLAIFVLGLGMALSGCGGSASTGPTPSLAVASTAREYYESDALRAEALASCRASSEAELARNMAKSVCKAALLAQRNHDFGLGAPK